MYAEVTSLKSQNKLWQILKLNQFFFSPFFVHSINTYWASTMCQLLCLTLGPEWRTDKMMYSNKIWWKARCSSTGVYSPEAGLELEEYSWYYWVAMRGSQKIRNSGTKIGSPSLAHHLLYNTDHNPEQLVFIFPTKEAALKTRRKSQPQRWGHSQLSLAI